MNTALQPKQGLLDPKFEYRNAASTDITITWRKHGWLPLNEQTVSDEYLKGYAAGVRDTRDAIIGDLT